MSIRAAKTSPLITGDLAYRVEKRRLHLQQIYSIKPLDMEDTDYYDHLKNSKELSTDESIWMQMFEATWGFTRKVEL